MSFIKFFIHSCKGNAIFLNFRGFNWKGVVWDLFFDSECINQVKEKSVDNRV